MSCNGGASPLGPFGVLWNVFGLREGAANAEWNTAVLEAYIRSNSMAVLPPGTYDLAEGSLLGTVCLQIGSGISNFLLRGQGEGITTLRLGNAQNSSVINIDGATNIKVQNLTVDGNRANNTGTSWHGIRTGNLGCNGLEISGVTVQQTRGYGFGLQGGNKKRLRLENCTATDTGLDGCDFKNISDDSEDIVIVAYSARNWGLDGSVTEQAGLDCRGPCQVFGVWTSGAPADGHHVRVREGEVVDPSLGGHFSHLHGLVCEGRGGATEIGLYIAAHDVAIHGAHVSGCFLNTLIYGLRVTLTGVTCHGALDENFQVNEEGGDARLVGCHSLNAGGVAFRLRGPRSVLVGCSSRGDVGGGITTEATAQGCSVTDFTGFGTGGTSVGIDNTAAALSVTGGAVSGFFRGLSTIGARTKFVGVQSHSNTDDGLLIGVGGDDCSVVGCAFNNNTDDGITLRAARARIVGNNITSNGGVGLDIINTATSTFVDDNTFSGNTAAQWSNLGTDTVVGVNSGLPSPYQTELVLRLAGNGTPEAVVTAPVGSIFQRRDGGAGTCFYVKESGTGNTGWVAK